MTIFLQEFRLDGNRLKRVPTESLRGPTSLQNLHLQDNIIGELLSAQSNEAKFVLDRVRTRPFNDQFISTWDILYETLADTCVGAPAGQSCPTVSNGLITARYSFMSPLYFADAVNVHHLKMLTENLTETELTISVNILLTNFRLT